MERVLDIAKLLIGVILFISFVAIFSSCEEREKLSQNSDDSLVVYENRVGVEEKNDTTLTWKERMKKESAQIDKEFNQFKKKAHKAGKQFENDVNKSINKLNAKRKSIFSDSTNAKMERDWEEFKQDVRRLRDSINKKI